MFPEGWSYFIPARVICPAMDNPRWTIFDPYSLCAAVLSTETHYVRTNFVTETSCIVLGVLGKGSLEGYDVWVICLL
jgi:hypothetical protein